MPSTEKITVALTEDNPINRNTFLQKFEQLSNYTLSFVARNGDECLGMLKGMPLSKLPRVIFMDIEMPGLNGIQTIGMAKALHPGIHFIVLTVFDDDEKIFDAIRAGASGYLLKHEPAGFLESAIQNVLEFGGAPMSPAIARKALKLLSVSQKTITSQEPANKQQLPEMITVREEQILQHMVQGWDAKKIASILNISVLTVRKHIANIYEKLHVQSRAEIINMAHQNKWFQQ
jgi:DNA-binding NarL/FixJ family response regulator